MDNYRPVKNNENADSRKTSTIQSVKRALNILRILSSNPASHGMRFSELQKESGLSKSTLHRILKSLQEEGFVEQERASRAYYLGLEFLSLSEQAGNRRDIRAISQPILERLASKTSDTVMLTLKSGFDAVCVGRIEGAFPVKVLTQNVGTKRPLGIGSGSLALLAALSDQEINIILRANHRKMLLYPRVNSEIIKESVNQTRSLGYAFNPGYVLDGMYGIGVTVYLRGLPIAALSIAAHQGRMGLERRRQLSNMLRQESEYISNALA